MTEAHRTLARLQHSGRQTLVETLESVPGERLEQPHLDVGARDGYGLEQRACSGSEPRAACQHCVAHRRRNLRTRSGEHFGDEEGVPGRPAV